MKKNIIFLVSVSLILLSCSNQANKKEAGENPFFSEFNTAFNLPPFEKIREEHFLPAYKRAMKQQQQEIEAIVNNPEFPTFENTIEAREGSGILLREVRSAFSFWRPTINHDNRQIIAKEVASLTSYRDDISLNEKLSQRIKAVYDQKGELNLTTEQNTLLEKYYRDYVRSSAKLDEEEKVRLREINKELSLLVNKFGENILKENNRFGFVIEKEEDLAGLTQAVIKRAAEAAKERGHEGKWVFTLHNVSGFLGNAEKRPVRENIYKAYINRCNNNDELDNKAVVSRAFALRAEKANLLGYKTYAHFVLEKNMAKTPENVYKFLERLWKPALKMAKKEANELQEMIRKEGKDFKLQPWDWRYYAGKLKKAKYDLDGEMLRPYFKLENVLEGFFDVANRLYGIQFIERTDIPRFHKDVKTFEVKEADGSHIGIVYLDFFQRANKPGGAWMSILRNQSRLGGKDVYPVPVISFNFSKPTGIQVVIL